MKKRVTCIAISHIAGHGFASKFTEILRNDDRNLFQIGFTKKQLMNKQQTQQISGNSAVSPRLEIKNSLTKGIWLSKHVQSGERMSPSCCNRCYYVFARISTYFCNLIIDEATIPHQSCLECNSTYD